MHRAWIEFIRNGNPGWEPYTLDRRATMKFADESELVLDPDGAEREAWEGLR
jgi:para-nitrobenzyl esterase